MRLRPIHDRIWVEKLPDPDRTPSGLLYIPASARDKRNDQAQRGKVVAAGPGRRRRDGTVQPMNPAIEPGVVVLWGKYGATETKVDGRNVVVVQEDDVLAVETP